jgi:Flp pilus assembly protein TadG
VTAARQVESHRGPDRSRHRGPDRSRHRSRHRDRGAVGAFVAVLAPVVIALVGLVYDGGLALEGRQRALNIAEQAARAAGNECDEALLRSRSECLITDQAGVQRIAEGYMGGGVSLAAPVSIIDNSHTVIVRTEVKVETVFLGLFGLHEFDIVLPERRATAVTGLA